MLWLNGKNHHRKFRHNRHIQYSKSIKSKCIKYGQKDMNQFQDNDCLGKKKGDGIGKACKMDFICISYFISEKKEE